MKPDSQIISLFSDRLQHLMNMETVKGDYSPAGITLTGYLAFLHGGIDITLRAGHLKNFLEQRSTRFDLGFEPYRWESISALEDLEAKNEVVQCILSDMRTLLLADGQSFVRTCYEMGGFTILQVTSTRVADGRVIDGKLFGAALTDDVRNWTFQFQQQFLGMTLSEKLTTGSMVSDLLQLAGKDVG